MKAGPNPVPERHAWFRPIQRRLHLPPFEILLAWFLMLGSVFALYYWNFRAVSNIHAAAVAVNAAGIARWEQVLKRELDQRVWEQAYEALFDTELIAAIDSGRGLAGLSVSFFENHPVAGQVVSLEGDDVESVVSPALRTSASGIPEVDEVASALRAALTDRRPDDVVADAFRTEDRLHQLVAVQGVDSSESGQAGRGHGILVDLEWVGRELLALVAEQQPDPRSERNPILHAGIEEAADSASIDSVPGTVEPAGDILPFVRVRIADEATLGGAALARRSLLLIAISSGLFLTVVIMMGVHIMRARKALEMAERRSAIVGSTSHALRTPLTIMSLYADTLATSRNLNESDREYSEIIARECTRMLHQVEDGLNFARIAAGRQTYKLVPEDLNTLVQTSFASYERYLARSEYTVEPRFSDEPLPFEADGVAISFALDNVIQNAIKYGGDAKYLRIETFGDGDDVGVEITDRGVGIPEAEQGQIFDEFYRASTSSERRGWGLGLYIVRHVVEGHRGRIEITSEVGEGTSFRVYFPRRSAHVLRRTGAIESEVPTAPGSRVATMG